MPKQIGGQEGQKERKQRSEWGMHWSFRGALHIANRRSCQ